ncbi:beta strand repeat-containing protein [Archangium primigenium]|uniref:beta strand repeat-containing protein n=1 Tax=[Archangium] primigenium TaxID=2792470 RepID=UPI0019578125|nr:hypothetical protein [Archangium primigenium]MBM7116984.1 hypothetical protein [Archangium primigenium]
MKTLTKLIAPLLLGVLAACGNEPTPGSGPVTVSPKSITVKAGDSATLTASVEGTQEPKILWSVEGEGSGTITSAGVYTAPPQAGSYTVVATNALDATKKDTAAVTVTAAVVITLTPTSPSVSTAGSLAFSAEVTGASDTSVTWSVKEGATGGSITAAGVYTAPDQAGTYTVVATSVADPSRSASTQVRVEAPGITVTPNGSTVDQGAVVQFASTVTGVSNTSVTWSVTGGGTITASGIYTAPAQEGTITVIATSVADPTKKGSATLTVRPVQVSITPPSQTIAESGTAAFYATVTGTTASTAVTWSVEGGSANGTISASGLYTAPAKAGTYTVVATSVANPAKKATAQVTVGAVSVTISPESVTLTPGTTATFRLTVTGSSNTAALWSVVGGDDNGTITSAGVYTAPARAGTYTVVGALASHPDKKAQATVTVTSTTAVSVSITPGSATIATGGSATFSAQVTGASDTSVTWSVREGATAGSISAEGVYTAPAQPGLYTVVATSVSNPGASATAQVRVEAPGVTVTPNGATVDQGAVVEFSANVTGTSNTSVTWSVTGGGTITASGIYTAPAQEGTVTITATSVAYPAQKGSATLTVRPVQVTLTPASQTISESGTAAFYATVTGTTASTAVTWSVEGGASNGTISASGVYTAPAQAGTYTVVATSVANPDKKATGQVTVQAVSVAITPTWVTLAQGATTTFTASVTGTSNQAVLWSVEGGDGNGTITSSGIYTAPTRPGTFTVVAASAAVPSKTATATVTVPVASGGDYTNPTGTGWRLVKNTSASSGTHLVLDLVGPTGQSGRGVDLTLTLNPAQATWAKVSGSDMEWVTNRLFELGAAPRLIKGAAQGGRLDVGVFQKGTSVPATPYSGALLSVAVDVKVDASIPAGTRIPLTVLKAHALPATGSLAPIDVAVGTIITQ